MVSGGGSQYRCGSGQRIYKGRKVVNGWRYVWGNKSVVWVIRARRVPLYFRKFLGGHPWNQGCQAGKLLWQWLHEILRLNVINIVVVCITGFYP